MRFVKPFVFLLLPIVGFSQITQRNLLRKNISFDQLKQSLISRHDFHPFPINPVEWKRILPDSVIQVIIHTGETSLKGDFPNVPATIALDFLRNGNRTRYENITFGKRNRLWNLVLAESVEGKHRFVDEIVNGIWSICEESFWGASAHLFLQKAGPGLPDVKDPVVDLFAAETAATLAFADYFMNTMLDSVSPLIRPRIADEVQRRIFVPMETARYEWMHNGDTTGKLNNWAPWIMSNYLVATLLLEKNEVMRSENVWRALRVTDQYINGFGDNGSCEEGPAYWANGTGCMLDVLDLLTKATDGRINIFNEPIIAEMGAYIYRTHIAENFYVNVADAHPEVYPEAIMVWRYGSVVRDSTLRSFGSWLYRRGANNINPTFHRSRALFDLLNVRSVMNEQSVYKQGAEYWMPDVELLTIHLPNGLFLASHGGNNGESHNHNDVGDFIVYANADPVIIDVGSGTYTSRTFSKDRYNLWFNASAWHNLPTINGTQQAAGSTFKATDVTYKHNKSSQTLSMNISEAYPASAGVRNWKRDVIANGQSITISDKIETAKPVSSLTQTFMTVCEVELGVPGVIIFKTDHGQIIRLHYGKMWRASKETMPLTTEEEQGLKVTWHNRPITRVLLTLQAQPSKATFFYGIGGDTE